MEDFYNFHLFSNVYPLTGMIVSVIFAYYILHSYFTEDKYIQTKFNPKGHTWRSIQCNKAIPYNILCTTCNKLMLPTIGLFCECCGLSTCKKCVRRTSRKYKCRTVSSTQGKQLTHFWVKVGTTRDDHLAETSDEENSPQGYFCSWCNRLVYTCTSPDNNQVCDFGKYRNLIIPPTAVIMGKRNLFTLKPSVDDHWEPLIVLANKKSGSMKGDEILSLFRGLLNPIQVLDLSECKPESIVKWLPSKCRILVAGGDGTIAWVLNSLVGIEIKASVAVLPLGTGNDLSRVLGWGATIESDIDPHVIIKDIMRAKEDTIDRWKVTISHKPGRLGRQRSDINMYAYNYISVGVDAQVALDFHNARTHILKQYTNRTVNYILYLCFGTQRVLDDGGCRGLEKRLKVTVDDNEQLELPPIQSLVLLNIPSWGAGVNLWDLGDANSDIGRQSINDGKIEVIGISSSFHIARLKCGLDEPFCLKQAQRVKIELRGKTAMQIDGEPWIQAPCTITVDYHSKANVLLKNTETESDIDRS